jgi:capsular polysaccharide export protein
MNAKRNKKRMSVVPREAARVLPDAAFIDAAHSPTVLPLFPSRRFLFLQGVPGSFLHVLGLALTRRGHSVFRVNFNGGDRMAWPLLPATDFRGRMTEWPSFLQRLILDFAPTDMVLIGDCRPLHRTAIGFANRHGIAVHVFEEGYLRPDWVTLEIGGVNGYSRLPRDPAVYRAAAVGLPALPASAHVPPSVRTRALGCVAYATSCLALSPLFPRYITHRGWSLLQEGSGWLRRARRALVTQRRSQAAKQVAFNATGGFFLLPIQMDNDSQILCHSDLGGMTRAIHLVVASFARHAPRDAVLAVKEHPLDNGVIDWRGATQAAARKAGVADRVVVIENYDLQELLNGARGLVTVNSTSATFALAAGVPVIALGRSVYDLPGLTHQGSLESFWIAPSPPDTRLFDAFRRALRYACLVEGDFFTRDGIARAVASAVPRIEAARDAAARIESLQRRQKAGAAVPA